MSKKLSERYKMARDEIWPILDKICAIAQTVTAATKAHSDTYEIDLEAIGILNEVIVEETQKIDEVFGRCLENP